MHVLTSMFNALFVTILSLAHISDIPSYCTGANIRNQQPGWVLIFEGAYFHGVLINECGSMQLCGNRLAMIYFRSRGSFPANFLSNTLIYSFSTTRDAVSNCSLKPRLWRKIFSTKSGTESLGSRLQQSIDRCQRLEPTNP